MHIKRVKGMARALGLAALLAAGMVRAAGGPPMLTDDPGTPGDGNWEINIAATSAHSDQATKFELPLVDVNFGVGDRIQLKFEMPWLVQKTQGDYRDGSGNGLLGVKWRFYDHGEDYWQISTYPQLESGFPSSRASHRSLADSGTSFLLPMEFLHEYGSYDINFEVGRWIRPGRNADTWIAGAVLTREVRTGLEVMAELRDETTTNLKHEELAMNLGARYSLSTHSILLLSAGRDLHNTLSKTNTLISYLGWQLLF